MRESRLSGSEGGARFYSSLLPLSAFRFSLSAFRFFLQYSARLFMVMMGENINARRVR